jgi:hypothetical protein
MPPFKNEKEILAGLYGLSIDDDDVAGAHPVPLTGVKVEVCSLNTVLATSTHVVISF